jgi:hypothetical protein
MTMRDNPLGCLLTRWLLLNDVQYAAKLGAKSVVAIEPMPRNYMLIAASVVANELQVALLGFPVLFL